MRLRSDGDRSDQGNSFTDRAYHGALARGVPRFPCTRFEMIMQVTPLVLSALLVAVAAGTLSAADRGDGPRGDRRHRGADIIIEPNIDLSRPPRPNVDAPDFIMAEVSRCDAAGVRLFVDCLRQNHTSIMIRRLEACVGSETIPDELQRVAVCLPSVPRP